MAWSRTRRILAGGLAAAVSIGLLGPIAATPATAEPPSAVEPSAAAKAVRSAKTTKAERKRVDRVKTPKLKWYTCFGDAQCATARLPRDYDKPKGAKVTVALLKRKATDQRRKVGTLFVNPGGPGASGTEMAFYADVLLSPEILARFDIVGFDPRGIAFSSQVKCYSSARTQAPVLDLLNSKAFPYGKTEERKFIKGFSKHSKACSKRGRPLSASMSTAEVARDMDVLRRAVGDKKLSYLGFSYGSYLGAVYANMFPDRVRAVAIDGVVDPRAWAGRKSTMKVPVGERLRSAEASWKALREILRRCQDAGADVCSFATGDPIADFDLVAERLKRKPLRTGDPFFPTIGYSDLVGFVLGSLYLPDGYLDITYTMADLLVSTDPAAARAAQRAAAKRVVSGLRKAQERRTSGFRRSNFAFPYDNSLDAFAAVTCTDSVNDKNLSRYRKLAVKADLRAKYFGRAWLWSTANCSSTRWTAKDEDGYRGTFNRRTRRPVLIVGNFWDPATSYQGARSAARQMPNSRLLSSDSWGHTAYGSSTCVTVAVDRYLLVGRLPKRGTTCVGDIQPFVDEAFDRRRAVDRQLVTPPFRPGAGPLH